MSDTDTPIRRPGPWDPKPEDLAAPPPNAAARVNAPEAPLDKGQHPVWAVISTALLGGFIWWISGSWVSAVAAIWGLFVHEYGHVLAMNRVGMGPARIYIIPFLGGLAKGQRPPQSEWHGVLVSLAGPAFGLLAAIPFFAGFVATGNALWLQGVFAIALINFVNLAPAPPLDGSKALGPVLARIHPWLEMAAMVLVGVTVVIWGFTNGSYIFAAFLTIALIGHLRRGAWRPYGRPLSWAEAGKSTGLYLLTALACAGVTIAALAPGFETLPDAASQAGRFFEFGR